LPAANVAKDIYLQNIKTHKKVNCKYDNSNHVKL
jgi:hypothetical protein